MYYTIFCTKKCKYIDLATTFGEICNNLIPEYMLTVLSIIIYLLATIAFSFVLWRNLKEDYTNEQIFGWSLRIFLTSTVVIWMAQTWVPNFTFLLLFSNLAVFGIFFLKRLNLKFFETIDAFTPAWLIFTFISWIGVGIGSKLDLTRIQSYLLGWFFPQIIIACLSLGLFHLFRKNYRHFTWYPSGKVGFAGLSSLGIFWLLFTAIEIYNHFTNLGQAIALSSLTGNGIIYLKVLDTFKISWSLVSSFISLIISIILFVMVYLRSGLKK